MQQAQAGRDIIALAGREIHFHQAGNKQIFTPVHQLPSPPANFAGRDEELAELEQELTASHASGATISSKRAGLQGMGGVGKTALAIVLAHKLKDRYPDAQIFLNLRGADPDRRPPVAPADAIQNIIHAFQPEVKLPEELDELTAIYHGVLNQAGRVLLVLDNAAGAEQVRPLLPPANCLLLVTSREHFTLPGMVARDIDCLRPAKSQELLFLLAPRIKNHEQDAAELCGHLPLALEVFAGVVASHKIYSVPDLVERLRQQPAQMTRTDATFQVSHDLLADDLRRRWTRLAVFAASFDLAAAAAVWDEQEESAREAMQGLVNASQVEWNQANGRFRLHDLVRDFCLGKLTPDIIDAVHLAHARHYAEIAAKADKLYLAKGKTIEGLALFDRERAQIEAAYAWLAGREDEAAARQMLGLVNAVAYTSILRFHPRQRIAWSESHLRAACGMKERRSQGAALANLGQAHFDSGEAREAILYHEQALVIFREIGDLRGVGHALNNLGLTCAALGDNLKAIQYHEQVVVIALEVGERRLQGSALGCLGLAHAGLNKVSQAIKYYEDTLAVFREVGNRRGEGNILGNLGRAYKKLGDARQTIEYHQQALVIFREIGDRRGEGNALWNTALELYTFGNRVEAVTLATAALVIFEAIEEPNVAMVRAKLAEWRGKA